MSVKDTVLKILEENKGLYVSGQKIANDAEASRAAVWKAISQLRSEGHIIEASTNKGYLLTSESDLLSTEGIHQFCKELSMENIHLYKTIDSTNTKSKQLASQGIYSPSLVVSETQTKGRGRMGRSFFSPASTGIYLSLIIKPDFNISRSILVTTAASVAVCRAIEDVLNISCQIKWVNDIFYKDKKIGGILTEGITNFESGQIEYIVIGIGINYFSPIENFPKELEEIAGYLINKNDSSCILSSNSRNRLIGTIISHLIKLLSEIDDNSFLTEYKSRSLVIGHPVTYSYTENNLIVTKNGIAIDLDKDGGLLVKQEDGTLVTLKSGEVTLRKITT